MTTITKNQATTSTTEDISTQRHGHDVTTPSQLSDAAMDDAQPNPDSSSTRVARLPRTCLGAIAGNWK